MEILDLVGIINVDLPSSNEIVPSYVKVHIRMKTVGFSITTFTMFQFKIYIYKTYNLLFEFNLIRPRVGNLKKSNKEVKYYRFKTRWYFLIGSHLSVFVLPQFTRLKNLVENVINTLKTFPTLPRHHSSIKSSVGSFGLRTKVPLI